MAFLLHELFPLTRHKQNTIRFPQNGFSQNIKNNKYHVHDSTVYTKYILVI